MAQKTWILTDVQQDIYLEQLAVGPGDVDGGTDGWSVAKRTLRGGLRDGVDVIEVDNGTLRFVVVPTRGMGIWRAWLGDLQLGWNSPVRGPVNPAFVHTEEPSGIGWLDGFDEMLVRCGLEHNGAPEFNDDGTLRYGLHGKIANVPAHTVEVVVDGEKGEIAVRGVVDEARLFGNKLRMVSTVTTKLGRPGLTVSDEITNVSAEPGELELFYHINFGAPLLEPGSKVVLPVGKLAPRDAAAAGNVPQWDTYGEEAPGLPEVVFFHDLAADSNGDTQVLLHNAAGDSGVSLRFNKNQMPCFTQWKCQRAAADGYVTGLEPGVNFPNVRSFEQQHRRVVVLQPGESRRFEIDIDAHTNADEIATVKQAVAKIQEGVVPIVLDRPDPKCSPFVMPGN